ncbi:hypothetical protein [Streptomyces sp. DASNCL29]|uniref:hypothetical protein n=1 Tax=Streptomyces sp. DASNCL29 TaxID=2583819 RepID=UPI00110F7966|nr:hypothetical protein [Streptomyces sp. DASNCL29]TMU98066.1 hypothetical protein FGK60_09530 [Streptomyces sp. DASNCL29]
MTTPTLPGLEPARPVPASVAGAGPAPLLIGLDVAMGVSGVAGVGWTDHVRCTAKGQHERFAYQLDGLSSFYRNADLVVIEGAAYSKNNQGADALAAMRWMVRHDLWKRGIPYAIVPPDQRVKYLTGTTQPKDPATGKRATGDVLKGIVRAAVADRYGLLTEGRWRYDEADAYALVAMGLHQLGAPVAEVSADCAAALAGCRWPDLEAVTR